MRLKRSKMISKIIVFALFIYAIFSLINTRGRIESIREEQSGLRRAVAQLEMSNAELEYKIENYNEPDVIADIARSDLGLVLPGEIIFYDASVENAP